MAGSANNAVLHKTGSEHASFRNKKEVTLYMDVSRRGAAVVGHVKGPAEDAAANAVGRSV